MEYTDERGYTVHHISIKQEDKISIFQLLDQHILHIHQVKTDRYTAKYVKGKLKNFIDKQTFNNKKGAVAEIFTHLLLKLLYFEIFQLSLHILSRITICFSLMNMQYMLSM